MITTISEILVNNQVQKIDTIYSESLNEMTQFQSVGNFFQVKEQAGKKELQEALQQKRKIIQLVDLGYIVKKDG